MNKVLIIEDEIDTATPVREALALESIEADIAKDYNVPRELDTEFKN